MRVRLYMSQDFAAGVMFTLWGAAGLWFGRQYQVGTSLEMGPGYLPRLLCYLLIVFGIGIGAKGILGAGAPLARWHLRPLVLVNAGLAAFALLIESAGLPAAVVGTVIIGALGGQEFRWREITVLALGLAAGAAGIFVYGLGLPMPLVPR